MSDPVRKNLRKPLQRFPKWVLLILVVVVGFPLHLGYAKIEGAMEGWSSWLSELREVLSIETRGSKE